MKSWFICCLIHFSFWSTFLFPLLLNIFLRGFYSDIELNFIFKRTIKQCCYVPFMAPTNNTNSFHWNYSPGCCSTLSGGGFPSLPVSSHLSNNSASLPTHQPTTHSQAPLTSCCLWPSLSDTYPSLYLVPQITCPQSKADSNLALNNPTFPSPSSPAPLVSVVLEVQSEENNCLEELKLEKLTLSVSVFLSPYCPTQCGNSVRNICMTDIVQHATVK